ncbi:MAG: alpha/beta hydrolase [Acidimicrobiia bacterium]|nr:alpha/beta hydrolase [Acidimicrobiia bacterium]
MTWIVGILLVIVMIGLAGFWYVRENPLALYEKTTRSELEKAGFVTSTFDSGVGRLTYWEAGTGPELILLHGVGDQAGAFQGIVESLTSDFRVVIPDLAGHGASEPIEGPLSMHTVYEGLEDLLDEIAAEQPVILAGSSMGAWLSTVYAYRHPEEVARVIAINGGPLRGERTDLSLTPGDREAARTLMAALRDPESAPVPDFVLDDIVEQSASGPIGRMMERWEDFEEYLLDGRLSEVSVPVDLVWGESDQLMSLDYAGRVLDGLPRARLTTIERCGHHPANECPSKLARTLAEILAMEPPEAKAPAEPAEPEEPEGRMTEVGD